MGSATLVCFAVLFLHFLVSSGSSIPGQGARVLFSRWFAEPELDAATPGGNIPVVNPTTPASGTTPPTSGTNPPDFGTTPPDFGTTPPISGTIPPGFGTTPPVFGTTPPISGATPSSPTFNPTTPTTTSPPMGPNGPSPTVSGPASLGGGQWCIASPTASPTALQVALDYACGYGGADCSMIQPGASCYEPNTPRDHASYAFNSYYQKHPGPNSCAFGGAAQLTNTDPSKGNCHYPSSTSRSTSTSTSSPPTQLSPPAYTPPTTNPATMPTTTPTTTPTMGIPSGPPTVYGAGEPTGLPSSAASASHGLTLLVVATGLLIRSLAGNYQ